MIRINTFFRTIIFLSTVFLIMQTEEAPAEFYKIVKNGVSKICTDIQNGICMSCSDGPIPIIGYVVIKGKYEKCPDEVKKIERSNETFSPVSDALFERILLIMKTSKKNIRGTYVNFSDKMKIIIKLINSLTKRSRTDIVASKAIELLEGGNIEATEELLINSYKKKYQFSRQNVSYLAAVTSELGLLKELQFDNQNARILYEEAVDLMPDNADHNSHLGRILYAEKNFKMSIIYFKRALKINSKLLGSKNLGVAKDLFNLGMAYDRIGKGEKAKKYLCRALAIKMTNYDERNLDIVKLYNKLDRIPISLDFSAEVIYNYLKGIDLYVKKISIQTSKNAEKFNYLDEERNQLISFEVAKEYFDRALEINQMLYRQENPINATLLRYIGESLLWLNDPEGALEYLNKALEFDQKIFGDKHFAVAQDHYFLGLAWLGLNVDDKATEHLIMSNSIYDASET